MNSNNQSKSSADGGNKLPRKADSFAALSENQCKLMSYFGDPEVERALAPYAVASSTAHVRVLISANIVSEKVGQSLIAGLKRVNEELRDGAGLATRENADLYAGLERRLTEIVGDSARMLREGLTTEEELATDSRLWIRSAAIDLLAGLNSTRLVLLALAERDIEAVMPGYIHLQPDTPGLLSHFWLLCESRLTRDSQRLRDFYARVNRCPLGKNAFSNAGLAVEREEFARLLGFDGMVEESFDVVSDRDYILEFASFAAIVGTHISQLASELIIWSTQEFGFVRLPRAFQYRGESFTQKRTTGLLEALRGRSASFTGRLTQFLVELKGLPVSYSQDLTEPFPDAMEVVTDLKFVLDLTSQVLPAMLFDTEKMAERANVDMASAGSAIDFLVERGFPPNKAQSIVASLITYCKERTKQLSDLTQGEWQQFSPAFDSDIYKYVSSEGSTGAATELGSAQIMVQQSVALAKARLNQDVELQESLADRLLNFQVEDPAKNQ